MIKYYIFLLVLIITSCSKDNVVNRGECDPRVLPCHLCDEANTKSKIECIHVIEKQLK